MNLSASHLAARHSFQLIANCYLREAFPGTWHARSQWDLPFEFVSSTTCPYLVEVELRWLNVRLWIEIQRRSLVGCHQVECVRIEKERGAEPVVIDFVTASVLLFREIGNTGEALKKRIQMAANVIQSHLALESGIGMKPERSSVHDTFVASEQSAVLGHWFHPAPMNRIGMSAWQNAIYSPEHRSSFQLHYFRVNRNALELHGISAGDYLRLTSACCGCGEEDGMLPIPVHPLQAQYLLSQPSIQRLIEEGHLRDVGRQGREFSATSSVRTVYHAETEVMLKLSIPVKITNSVRTNKRHDLAFCGILSRILQGFDFASIADRIELLLDYAGATVSGKLVSGDSGFEVLFRQNPFIGEKARGVHSPVTLFQEPLPGRHLQLDEMVMDLSYAENCSVSIAAQRWFQAYIRCGLITLIEVFDRFGVVFESHLQNCLIRIEGMLPVKLYHRDTEGSYLSTKIQQEVTARHPEVKDLGELFFEEEKMVRIMAYYLMVNHVFACIHRFGADGLMEEAACIALIRDMLIERRAISGERGRMAIDYFLHSPTLECKSNLKTQLQGVDELANPGNHAVYVRIPNPLCIPLTKDHEEVRHEVLD